MLESLLCTLAVMENGYRMRALAEGSEAIWREVAQGHR